ncbi:MAG TPA: hypothetical protein VN381_12580 [Anaerovoracaceae bacterium]|nr:hypothetical protein [Anaerovoracaceae bacterium]
MENSNTKKIATGGVLLALSVVTLFGATFVPGVELTLYALTSAYVAIIVIEFNAGMAWLFYIASVLLSAILVPNKGGLIPYVIFFGVYAIIKYWIEKGKKLSQPVEIILKLLFGNGMFALGYLVFGAMFAGAIQMPDAAWPIILAGAQLFFLVYDYILTLVIGFYLKRRPKT